MAQIFVITGTQVIARQPNYFTWSFMFDSKAPFPEFGAFSSKFGFIFQPKDWEIHLFDANAGGLIYGSSCSNVDQLPSLLIKAVEKASNFVILMTKDTYDRLAPVMEKEGYMVGVHHFYGPLFTS